MQKSRRSRGVTPRARTSKSLESAKSAILLKSGEWTAVDIKDHVYETVDSIIARVLGLDKPSNIPVLRFEELRELCLRSREIILQEPPFLELEPPLYVFGDIHGQLIDLQQMLHLCGPPGSKKFLFLGDYVDRGAFGVETISLLLAFKMRFPDHVYLLRGNHETRVVNTVYGFSDECNKKYGSKGREMWAYFQSVFNCLPLSARIGERIFCAHGGISEHLYTFDQLLRTHRPTEITDVGLLVDLVWSDPTPDTNTYAVSPRGISKVFGKQACIDFCNQLNIDLICRAHQCVEDGYEFFADRRCLTVFSAPNYCGEKENKAGILKISKEMRCQVLTFKPEVKSNSMMTARM